MPVSIQAFIVALLYRLPDRTFFFPNMPDDEEHYVAALDDLTPQRELEILGELGNNLRILLGSRRLCRGPVKGIKLSKNHRIFPPPHGDGSFDKQVVPYLPPPRSTF